MTRSILNYRFLMEESERRIEQASRSNRDHERSVARRILESEKRHRSWECVHFRLMKRVAQPYSVEGQFKTLKESAIALTHRQALFGYLRDNGIRGQQRHVLFKAFYGPADYVNAVITEHGHFIRAASSSICATHLSDKIWHEETFEQALASYEEAYQSYFSVYCDCILAEAEGRELTTRPLLLFLKTEAMHKRSELLSEAGGTVAPYASATRPTVRRPPKPAPPRPRVQPHR